jgi:putative ABC transport system substrate-binding protein
MRRREFTRLLGGATVAWSVAAHAQQTERVRRIGVLTFSAESDPEGQSSVAAFREELRKLGWIEGRNIEIDIRWAAADLELMKRFAKELVALQPDLILTSSTPAAAAMLQETRTIPIVFVIVADPVGSGFVASLPRPGGNATGFTPIVRSLGGKWVELLKEIAPQVTRIALMSNPETSPHARGYLPSIETAARLLELQLIANPVHDTAEIERTIAAFGRDPGGGLVMLSDGFTLAHRELIVRLVDQYRVPTVYPFREFAKSGGLLSYGVDMASQFGQAAPYVDRILKGAKPGDLPVQAPTKFELIVNLKTAKALGLDVPVGVLAIADEVIE